MPFGSGLRSLNSQVQLRTPCCWAGCAEAGACAAAQPAGSRAFEHPVPHPARPLPRGPFACPAAAHLQAQAPQLQSPAPQSAHHCQCLRPVFTHLPRPPQLPSPPPQAADLEAARRWHAGMVARAMERRSRQQPPAAARQVVFSASRRDPLPGAAAAAGRPARPPVLVIQPDLGVGLCTLEEPAGSCGDGGEKEHGGAGPAGDSSGVAPSSSGGLAAAGTAPRSAVYSAAAGGGTGTLQAAAVAAAGPAAEPPPLPQLPVRLQRIALEFPGLGAAVLLLLPHQHGWLVWQEGSSWQQAAPRGPLPPMSSVEVLPEAAAAPAGAGAELARPGGGAARGGPPSEGAAEDALAADGAGSEGGGATQAGGTQ